jgi:ABC-type branched-subunit amino acid transport system ATPase component
VRPARLDVADIVVKFGGVTAIDGVTLSVETGSVVGLIGPNGAGKTTLIDTVTGYVRPAAGTVSLDGQVITGWPVYQRNRAGISRSFQSLELFESSTVRENLSVASDPIKGSSYVTDIIAPKVSPLTPAAVAAVIELDLEPYLDTLISDLPYGTRRLVAIARAIASQPSILLLDEPAAGLSSTETQELAVVIRRLVDDWGIGVLVIEHDMSFVMSLCDQIVVLNFGHQIAQGAPAEVRRDPAVVAAYLGGSADDGTEEIDAAPVAATAGKES